MSIASASRARNLRRVGLILLAVVGLPALVCPMELLAAPSAPHAGHAEARWEGHHAHGAAHQAGCHVEDCCRDSLAATQKTSAGPAAAPPAVPVLGDHAKPTSGTLTAPAAATPGSGPPGRATPQRC